MPRSYTPAGASPFDDIIAKLLVEKRYLTEEEISGYIADSRAKNKRLGTLLLENNVISRRDLHAMILSQMKNKDLPTILVEEKFISFEELTRVFLMKKGDLRKLGRYLVSSGILSENNLAMSLAKVFGLAFVPPEKLKPVKQLPEGFPDSFFSTFMSVVTKFSEKTKEIEFAICDPSTIGDIINSSIMPDYRIAFSLTTFGAIMGAIDKMFPKNTKNFEFEEFSEIEVLETISEFETVKPVRLASNFPDKILGVISDNHNSRIRPLFEVLYDAARAGASEVHFEAYAEGIKILLKMNGRYFNLDHNITPQNYEYIVAKVKHLSRLNYQDDRMFAEGGFAIGILSLKLFVDALIVPTLFGDNMLLKICALNNFPRPLENFFRYQKQYIKPIRKALEKQGGGIIILSSTDDFKLNKLYYSLLSELSKNAGDRKAVSIEKNIMYPVSDIVQIEYATEGFAHAVSPDLGELYETSIKMGAGVIASSMIHEAEAFEYVMRSVSTGALSVFNMNEPDIKALFNKIIAHPLAKDMINNLRLVIAAKNADFICGFCRDEDSDASVEKGFKVYRGAGCPKCNFTGVGEQNFIFEVCEPSAKDLKTLAAAIKNPGKLESVPYDMFGVLTNEFYKEGSIVI